MELLSLLQLAAGSKNLRSALFALFLFGAREALLFVAACEANLCSRQDVLCVGPTYNSMWQARQPVEKRSTEQAGCKLGALRDSGVSGSTAKWH